MTLIARTYFTKIYDNGDHWFVEYSNDKKELILSKETNPYFPLLAIAKYDAEPVNVEMLNNLAYQLVEKLAQD